MEIGEHLKDLRNRFNYSQRELSEKTGLTLRTIQRIENGEVKPSPYSLRVIGKALETDLSELIQNHNTSPYEFSLTLKIADMNQLIKDLKILIKNNWKILLLILIIILLLTNYTEIKKGLIDGLNNH